MRVGSAIAALAWREATAVVTRWNRPSDDDRMGAKPQRDRSGSKGERVSEERRSWSAGNLARERFDQMPLSSPAHVTYYVTGDLCFEVGSDSAPKSEKAWTATAMRRLAEIESCKEKLIPGEKVMAPTRKMLDRK